MLVFRALATTAQEEATVLKKLSLGHILCNNYPTKHLSFLPSTFSIFHIPYNLDVRTLSLNNDVLFQGNGVLKKLFQEYLGCVIAFSSLLASTSKDWYFSGVWWSSSLEKGMRNL